jgi:3-hydroxy-9,10-secoandrosta-1,3,5(10)-triene-9,17-dione monooxygenase
MRRLPTQSVADLREAGLFRVYQPIEHGGPGVPWGAHVQVALELGRGDGATAWCFSIAAAHNWTIGMMDPRAARDIWDANPEAIASSATAVPDPDTGAPNLAVPVEDGYLLDGRFTFSSGVDHSEWVCLSAPVQGGPPFMQYHLTPTSSVELLDTWYTTGLRGTGSRDVLARQVFVPAYHTFSFGHQGGPTAGSAGHAEPLFRLTTPFLSIYPYFLASPALGTAYGALEAFCLQTRGRTSPGLGQPLHAQPQIQLAVAETAAELDGARLLLERACAELNALTEAGQQASPEQQTRLARESAYAARVSRRAVDRLAADSGARGLYEHSPFQRYWRDVDAACAHTALTWSVRGMAFGQYLLDSG